MQSHHALTSMPVVAKPAQAKQTDTKQTAAPIWCIIPRIYKLIHSVSSSAYPTM
jgi:hypothetical protein